jgi:hypothetical protein
LGKICKRILCKGKGNSTFLPESPIFKWKGNLLPQDAGAKGDAKNELFAKGECMTERPKASDFLFLSGDEWDDSFHEFQDSRLRNADNPFSPLDDEQRAGSQFQAMIVNLTQIGAEVSLLKFEIENLRSENEKLQKDLSVLLQTVSEKQILDVEEFHLAREVMTMAEVENNSSDVNIGSQKKCDFLN